MVVTVILEHDHEVVTGTRRSGQGLSGNTRRSNRALRMEEYSTVEVYAGMCRAATQRKAARPEGHYDHLDAAKKQRRRRMESGLNSTQRSVDDEV